MLLAALCALIVLLAIVYVVVKRRPEPEPDPRLWREQRLEPWGSIVIGVWFGATAVLGIADVLGQRWVVPLVVASMLIGVPWTLIVSSRQVRRVSISETEIEWRTLRQRFAAPLSEVVAVSGPHRSPPQFWLVDGRVIRLPESPGVRVVARTLTEEFGVSWPPPDLDGWDDDGTQEEFESTSPSVWEIEARRVVDRRNRKQFGLDKRQAAQFVATGPPFVSLRRRADLLQRCRTVLAGRGLSLVAASPEEPYEMWFDGEAAERAANADEVCADTDGHWWVHDLVWQNERSDTNIFAPVDYDHMELIFVGWGSGAVGALHAVREAIEESRTSSG